jgi:FkbM family methyltransferase
MLLQELRHTAGRTVRNLKRNRIGGVGHDFAGDVRSRLPHFDIRTIFDVGAHIGLTAIEFSDEFPQATVHAFEPHPGNFARMQSNCAGKPEVRFYNLGLGAEPGALPFHFDPEHPTMARVVSNGEEVTDTVAIDTVDRLCDQLGITRIDFMKIDVEGHEIPVLEGSIRMLREGRISLLKLETAIDPDLAYHTQLWDLCELLQPLGYRLFGFYDQWENTLSIESAKLRRFDVAFISPGIIHRS